jgi:hypothetical protein
MKNIISPKSLITDELNPFKGCGYCIDWKKDGIRQERERILKILQEEAFIPAVYEQIKKRIEDE